MPKSDKYLKFFLSPGEMTSSKKSEYDYGVTGINSFFDSFNKPIILKTVIKPGEKYVFNSGVVFYPGFGVASAKLFTSISSDTTRLTLFYSISIGSDSLSIPCGEIIFKNN